MKCIKLATVVAAAVVLILAQGPVGAQGANFQWEDVTVNEALAALNRQYQLNYSISEELGQRRFSASLTNATLDKAFQTILEAANLTAANDAGVWRIQEKPERGAAAQGMRGQMPGLPQPMYGGGWGQPGFGARQPPMPFRQAPLQVQVGLGQRTGIAAEDVEKWDPENWVTRIIPLKYINPYLVTDMFGGTTVSEENYRGGGGGGGGGYGGGGYGGGGYGGGGYGGGGYGGGGYGGGGYGGRGGYGGGGGGYGGRGGYGGGGGYGGRGGYGGGGGGYGGRGGYGGGGGYGGRGGGYGY